MACGSCGKRAATVAKGAVGVAKALTRTDRADDATIAARRAICRACEFAVPCPIVASKKCTCAKCGCVLKLKTTIAGESCPVGKW